MRTLSDPGRLPRAAGNFCAALTALLAPLLLALLVLGLPGCASPDTRPLIPPQITVAPYGGAGGGAGGGEALWAVAPLRNESGVIDVDSAAITDRLVQAVEEVEGVRAVPLNRVIAAMRALELQGINTPTEAEAVARAVGADALVVGSLTSWDPYEPVVGLTLALQSRARPPLTPPFDPRQITVRPTDAGMTPPPSAGARPAAVYSRVYDAKNHGVLMDLRAYAQGRHDTLSAVGWRRYLASSELFAQFAAHHAVAGLVRSEWERTAREDGAAVAASTPPTMTSENAGAVAP